MSTSDVSQRPISVCSTASFHTAVRSLSDSNSEDDLGDEELSDCGTLRSLEKPILDLKTLASNSTSRDYLYYSTPGNMPNTKNADDNVEEELASVNFPMIDDESPAIVDEENINPLSTQGMPNRVATFSSIIPENSSCNSLSSPDTPPLELLSKTSEAKDENCENNSFNFTSSTLKRYASLGTQLSAPTISSTNESFLSGSVESELSPSTIKSVRRRNTFSSKHSRSIITNKVLEDIHECQDLDMKMCERCIFTFSSHSLKRHQPSLSKSSSYRAYESIEKLKKLFQEKASIEQQPLANDCLISVFCTVNSDQRFDLVKKYAMTSNSKLKADIKMFTRKCKFSNLYQKVICYLLLRTEEYDAKLMHKFINGDINDAFVIDALSFRTNMQIELMQGEFQRMTGKNLYELLKNRLKTVAKSDNHTFVKHLLLAQRDETSTVNERLAHSDAALLLSSLQHKLKIPIWTILGDRNFDQIRYTLLIFEKISSRGISVKEALKDEYYGTMFTGFQKRHVLAIINYAMDPAKFFGMRIYDMGYQMIKQNSKIIYEHFIWTIITRSEIDLKLIDERFHSIFVDPRDKQAKSLFEWLRQLKGDFKEILMNITKGNNE